MLPGVQLLGPAAHLLLQAAQGLLGLGQRRLARRQRLPVGEQALVHLLQLLPAGQDPKTYYTNAYLPPASEMRACK